MEFTVPAAHSLDDALDIFNGVKKYMNMQGHYPFDKPVQWIEYTHNGIKETAEVNQFTVVNKERVILIFECENLFLICTPERGVIRGEPILVGRHEIKKVVYFDSLPQK